MGTLLVFKSTDRSKIGPIRLEFLGIESTVIYEKILGERSREMTKTNRFAGKTAYVTGGARGIGRAVCQRLAEEGAAVLIMDLPEALDGNGAADGTSSVRFDMANRSTIRAAFAAGIDLIGPPNIFVACAGKKFASGSFETVTDENWDQYIAINLTGTFTCCQEAARAMIKAGTEGRIITVGSVNSFSSEPNVAPYASSKGGIAMMTRSMAVDLAKYQITVNMIAPGTVDVSTNGTDYVDEPVASEIRKNVALMRPGKPKECASAVAYLASDEASYVTGSTITIDGGLSAMVFGGTRDI
jgi:NAD(P)-dependent dehydrogenase (short-subunit alcohol dehydrogenase family)